MLTITIPSKEYFDNESGLFHYSKETTIVLEHSLVSLSKWESKWGKPFNDGKPKTLEEIVDYIRCMTITQNVPPDAYWRITQEILEKVNTYIDEPMTGTTFRSINKNGNNKGKVGREIVTAEIIYYWMFSYNIPLDCQKWHLNKLLTLIRVFNVKNTPQKKMSNKETIKHNQALNAARKKKLGTRG